MFLLPIEYIYNNEDAICKRHNRFKNCMDRLASYSNFTYFKLQQKFNSMASVFSTIPKTNHAIYTIFFLSRKEAVPPLSLLASNYNNQFFFLLVLLSKYEYPKVQLPSHCHHSNGGTFKFILICSYSKMALPLELDGSPREGIEKGTWEMQISKLLE